MKEESGLRKIQAREFAMVFGGSHIVSVGSRFGRFKETEMKRVPVALDSRLPAPARLVEANALVAVRRPRPSVPGVFGTCRQSEFIDSIIATDPVLMVDLVRGHFTMGEKPCKARCQIMTPSENDLSVAVQIEGAGDHADGDTAIWTFDPSENASVGVVGQIIANVRKAHRAIMSNLVHGSQALEASI